AWTRDDEPALAWYRGRGFTESDHYLHVHKGYDDPVDGFSSPNGLSSPLLSFCHAGDGRGRASARDVRSGPCVSPLHARSRIVRLTSPSTPPFEDQLIARNAIAGQQLSSDHAITVCGRSSSRSSWERSVIRAGPAPK